MPAVPTIPTAMPRASKPVVPLPICPIARHIPAPKTSADTMPSV